MFRLAIAQINTTAGDLERNTGRIKDGILRAKQMGADLVIFPELAVSGYPPEDLLIRPSFVRRCREALEDIASHSHGVAVVAGAPLARDGALHNAAVIMAEGKIAGAAIKTELPNYGVFDEKRYFTPSPAVKPNGPLLNIGPALAGISICEDIWVDNEIVAGQVRDGANFLVNISGSPYREGVFSFRRSRTSPLSSGHGVPLAYCNLVGGQDELVFDGGSYVEDGRGELLARLEVFREDFMVIGFQGLPTSGKPGREVVMGGGSGANKPSIVEKERRLVTDPDEEVYEALVLGTRDYVEKNGFPGAAVALSGGIDSALTCAIAVDALGPERVSGYLMPSPYSSRGSLDDAKKLAENLGVESFVLPIRELMEGFDNTLAGLFKGLEKDVTEENLQARIRGALMMAVSNKKNLLVLTTGNKSETAMGYCTLYGDMAGGLAVIKDLYKTSVYRLSRWRNRKAGHGLIPEESIGKPPSAELRPDQKDSDSLPPYEILDPILKEYIEGDKSLEEIVNLGHDRATAARVIRMVDLNEYKRRQGPLGLKITSKAFGRDRRLPITSRFREG